MFRTQAKQDGRPQLALLVAGVACLLLTLVALTR